jgi:eukaryotic-like serine/threonine-protein kinase
MIESAPAEAVLQRFLLGSASPEERAQVEAFLAYHPAAATVFPQATPADSFLAAVQAGGRAAAGDDQWDGLVTRLLTAVDAAPSLSAASATTLTGAGDGGASGPADWGLEPPVLPGEVGRLGPYRVLRLLGRGGMGLVFESEDSELGRRVALKVMRRDLAARVAARERFQREARAAARLENDHIVPIFGVGEAGGIPYIAMPLLRGEALDVRLKVERRLPLSEAVRIGCEVAEGLAAAHAAGMIHRDVKPGNVWLEAPRDRVKLLDFGLARKADGQENLTQSGAIVGTPAYMAPEQARGRGVDHRVDLFSLGILLYEMTTGCRPFTGPDHIAILTSIAIDTPQPPCQVNPAISTGLSNLIDRLLEKDPARRPASARQVADALADTDFRLAPSATDATVELIPPPVVSSRSRRSRLRLAVAALILLVAAVAIGFTVIRIQGRTGTLVIETDDPTIAVVVKQNGVTIRDQATDREIDLKIGDYTIELAEPKEGLKLSTDKVSITKNGREVVKVWLEKLAARPVVKPPVSDAESDRDRAVAEWVLSKKGYVTISAPSGLRQLQVGQKLPSGPIRLNGIGLYRPQSGPLSSSELNRLLDVTRLTYLQVHGNAIDDAWISRMAKAPGYAHLEHLDLAATEVTDNALTFLPNLSDLKTLHLMSNRLTDDCFKKIARINGLKNLSIWFSDLTGRGLDSLATLNLKSLSISLGTRADPKTIDAIVRLNSLSELAVSCPVFGDEEMAKLAGMGNLSMLNIDRWDLSGAGLRHIARLLRLERLNLSSIPRIDDPALAELQGFPSLKFLWIQECPVTDAGLDHIAKCRPLKELTLVRTQVTASSAQRLAAARPDLKIQMDGKAIEPATGRDDRKFAEWVLSIGGSVIIQNEQWVQKSAGLPEGPINLLDIQLSWAENPRPAADLEGLLDAPPIRRLMLTNCPITDAWIERMSRAAGLRQVQDLHIWRTASTVTAFPHLAELPLLQSLTLYDLPLSDDGMKDLARSKSLRILTLLKTGITPRGIEHLSPLNLKSLCLGESELKAMSADPNGWKVLKRLPSLRALILNDAPVPVFAFAELCELRELLQLNFVRTGLNRERLNLLAKLPHLNMLRATAEGEITDQVLDELATFPELQSVGLQDMNMTDAGLDQLAKCPKLTFLELTRTGVTVPGAKKLAGARPNLQMLLDGQSISGTAPTRDDRAFAEWVLSIGGGITISTEQKPIMVREGGKLPPGPCRLLDVRVAFSTNRPAWPADLNRLLDAPPLRHLQVVGLHATDEWVGELSRAPGLRQLRSLELSSGPLTNSGLAHLANLPNLETLLFFNQRLSDDGMRAVAKCKSVREMVVRYTGVTARGLEHLIPLNLKSLSLGGTEVKALAADPDGWKVLGRMPTLERVDLSGGWLGGNATKELAALPVLKSIWLRDMKVTEADLDQLVKCSHLTSLTLEKGEVNEEGVTRFRAAKPLCQVNWIGKK